MSIRPNRVKQRLAAGQVATILAGTNDPDMIDQLGPLGADGIWLEGEHGGVDYADLGNLTRACDLWGMTSVVRVMDNDYATIYRTLDAARRASSCRTSTAAPKPRRWSRPASSRRSQARHVHQSPGFWVGDYLKTANDQSLLIVLLEDIVAVENLDEILKVDHIDVFFVAPSDLATSMGHIGDMGHPESSRRSTGDREDRPVRPRGRYAGQFRQRGALHADGCPRDHDQLLPVDPGRREGPDGSRSLRSPRLTTQARGRLLSLPIGPGASSTGRRSRSRRSGGRRP